MSGDRRDRTRHPTALDGRLVALEITTHPQGSGPQLARKLTCFFKPEGETAMAKANSDSYDKLSDDALMHCYLELSNQPDANADELAAIDAAIQSRLFAAYGAAEPGTSSRVRFAA
ncbi:hypothetical protein ACFPOA_06925 [Lysobacter niabensis]|uniref:hypothetical protein n=1 Tax=Agrilutibacter niabensis TaxID=380628 RepID=UPI00360E7DCF